MSDEVNHPAHYTKGIETYEYIESWGMGYAQGNVIKYVSRYPMKGGLKDLLKARWYLDQLIEAEEAKEEEDDWKDSEVPIIVEEEDELPARFSPEEEIWVSSVGEPEPFPRNYPYNEAQADPCRPTNRDCICPMCGEEEDDGK